MNWYHLVENMNFINLKKRGPSLCLMKNNGNGTQNALKWANLFLREKVKFNEIYIRI